MGQCIAKNTESQRPNTEKQKTTQEDVNDDFDGLDIQVNEVTAESGRKRAVGGFEI